MTITCVATVNRRELAVSLDDFGRIHSSVKWAEIEPTAHGVKGVVPGDVIDISGSAWTVEEVENLDTVFIYYEPTYAY